MIYLDGTTLIFKIDDYYLINGVFKKGSKILYHDFVNLDGKEYLVEDYFQLNKDTIEVSTAIGNFYFEGNETVLMKDVLTNSIIEESASYLSSYDKLVFNKKSHNVTRNKKFEAKTFLYLDKYNYSTSISEILLKYKLPKKFLLKALSTGCPDDEWLEAKKWNEDLKQVMLSLNITDEEEFKKLLIRNYSNNIDYSLRKIKMDSSFVTLFSIFLLGRFKLKTHTTIDIICDSEDIFKDVLKFVLTYKLKHSIQNSTYNASYTSIVSVNSCLLHDLFFSNFNNLDFILDLSQPLIEDILNRISNQKFYLKSLLSAKYLQEFLLRSGHVYSIDSTSNNDTSYLLTPLPTCEETKDCFLVPIKDIQEISSQYLIGINLNYE